MKRKDRKQLEAFVRARTEELVEPRLRDSHLALLKLTELIKKKATKDADWDWIEAAVFGNWGGDGGGSGWADEVIAENIFGDDPESQAKATILAIHQSMALAHADHPDYNPDWSPRSTPNGPA